MAWFQRVFKWKSFPFSTSSDYIYTPYFSRFFSNSATYVVKVGIPEFLNGIGNGVEAHVAKLEADIGDIHKLLVTRTLKLKKLGIPCKHRKLILKHTQKYRLGLSRPRSEPSKTIKS